MEQRLHESKPGFSALANELDRGQMNVLGTHLAIADDTISDELKTSDAKVCNLHSSYFKTGRARKGLRRSVGD